VKYKRISEILAVFILPYVLLGFLSLLLGFVVKILFGVSFLEGFIFSMAGLYLLCTVCMGFIIHDKTTED
jgi:hypothetical protein